MNTRQKLTLGIAAIFMVTLTIVGVTYAYFVTRVTGDLTEQTVDVTTATIGEVRYEDEGSDVVEFTNVLPGVSKYKVFSVINDSTDVGNMGVYNIFLENTVETGKAQYIRTLNDTSNPADGIADGEVDLTSECYKSGALPSNDANPSNCFNGGYYDNILVSLYEVNDYTTADYTDDETGNPVDGAYAANTNEISAEAFAKLTIKNTIVSDQHLGYTTNVLATNQQVLGGAVGAANKVRYYVLKVEYANRNANQNLENEAVVNIRVSIN